MKLGEQAFFYHSSCKGIGISGIMEVAGTYYEDPLAVDKTSTYFDKKAVNKNPWNAVDMRFKERFSNILSLESLKKLAINDQRLAGFTLLEKGNRLSVMPISDKQWQCIIEHMAQKDSDTITD